MAVAFGWLLRSSAARVLGWPVFGSGAPRYIRWLHHRFCKISDARHWLYYRLHPRHRYHVVVTELGYGYHDEDDRLLYAAMACLQGYIQASGGEADLQRWTDELHDPSKRD